jgi:hypothetical protein
MQETTAPFAAAIALPGNTPVLIVELPTLSTYLATGSVPSRQILCGEPLCSPLVLCGQQVTYATRLAEGGVGRLSVELDPLSNATRRGGGSVSLLNQGGLGSTLRQGGQLTHARARVMLTFPGLSYADTLLLLSAIVDNSALSWERLDLSLLDESYRVHRDLSVPIGGTSFPQAPRVHHGRAIPIILGRQTNIEAALVSSAAQGYLAEAMTTGTTFCLLNELDAPFPAAGSLTIAAESLTYALRLTTTKAGISYLALATMTRGSPATHAAGTLVSLAGVSWAYLVGYECSDVSTVRDAEGAIIDPADYTVQLAADGADRPVTLVVCDSYQGDVIYVDAEGLNVTPQTALSNAGFEAGTLTGWTLGTSASGAVTTLNTVEGTYKAELTGSDGIFRDLYQDLTLIPDRLYTLEWYYKDTVGGTNLLTNGDWETGALAPWTAQAMRLGLAGVGSLTGVSIAVIAGAGAQGTAGLQFAAATPATTAFEGSVYVDVATSIGATYAFTLSSRGMTWGAWGGSGTPLAYQISSVGWQIGTTTQPWILANHPPGPTRPGEPVTFFTYGASQAWIAHGAVTFVATATTTRITLSAYSSAEGLAAGAAPPLVIDNVSLIQVTNLATSRTAYQLGTPADADAYAAATLDQQYGWTLASVTVRPTSSPLRLTLQSRWANSSTPSWLDAVRLYDTGRNPAETIAYVIDTFLPDMTRDADSFDVAYALLKEWQFGAFLPEPGDSKALLERMASQCKSRIVFDAAGRAALRTFDVDATPEAALTTDQIVEDSLTVEGVSLDTLYSEVHVWYGLKTGADRDSAESYQDAVYATPDGTNHPTRNLASRCQSAATTLRRSRRLDVFADMLRDAVTAASLLEYLVDRHTYRQDLITLRTWYAQIPLELGDPVTVEHPLLQASGAAPCEVLAWRPDPPSGQVELLLQTVRGMGLDDVPSTVTPGLTSPDLELWLEADVGTTIGAVNVGLPYDGTVAAYRLSAWQETSPAARTLTQAVEADQPLWAATRAYTHPAVYGDGVSDAIGHATALDFSGYTGATWFAVVRVSPLAGGNLWLVGRHRAATCGWGLGLDSYVPLVVVATSGTTYAQRSATVDLSRGSADDAVEPFHLVTACYSGTAGTLDLRVDGAASNGTLTGTVPSAIAGSGPSLSVGGWAEGGMFLWQGDVAALVVYGRALAPSERAEIEAHLLAKYGIV